MAKTQIDLSDIVMSPEFTQTIQVERHSNGRVVRGRYMEEKVNFDVVAVVSATDERDIQMIPEGDRNNESKTFHTIVPLCCTRGTGLYQGTSDIIKYDGMDWKVVTTINSSDYGYYKTIAVNTVVK